MPAYSAEWVLAEIREFADQWNSPGVFPEYKQFRHRLRSVPGSALFEGLLAAFDQPVHRDRRHWYLADQEVAGSLLFELMPRATVSLEDILHRVLPTWNLSVQEMPCYLVMVFDRPALLAALERFETEGSTQNLSASIETFRYWLAGLSDERILREHTERSKIL